MSDAFSDIARDEERAEYFNQYLYKVKTYVLNPTEDNFKVAIEAAKEVDSVGRGYWGGRTDLASDIEDHLKGLVSDDTAIKEKKWAKLLALTFDNRRRFNELKNLSPFADKMIVRVDYGSGFVRIKGFEWFEEFFYGVIRNQGMKTYDCDKYLVIMPPIDIKPEDIKAIWLRCGISGINGPRKPNEK